MVVRRASKYSSIVAGGGAIEMEISRYYVIILEVFLVKLNLLLTHLQEL